MLSEINGNAAVVNLEGYHQGRCNPRMNQLEFCIFRNNHHHQGDDDGDEFESARKINRSRLFS